MRDQDRILWQQLQEGQESAWKFLIAETSPGHRAWLMSNSCDHDLCQSIYNEALMRFYKKVKDIHTESPAGAMLFGYVRNVYREHRKRKHRDSVEVSIQIESDSSPDVYDNRNYDSTRFNLLVNPCLKALGENCQRVIKMRVWENKSHKDIAQILGYASVGVSRQRFARCFEQLRGCVRKREQYVSI